MVNIIMKSINLRLTILPFIFLCSLFASQQVLAIQKDFALATIDNSETGQGKVEFLPDSLVHLAITIQSREYFGAGVMTKTLEKSAKDLRADRAMMATTHKKRVLAELVAVDGTKLDCALNMKYDEIWGQCVNPSNQKIYTIKSLTGVIK